MYIYIFKSFGENNQEILKFGFSENPKNRLTTHLGSNPLAKILYVFYNKNAQKIESNFHINNIALYGREWYNISKLDRMMKYVNLPDSIILFNYKIETFDLVKLEYLQKHLQIEIKDEKENDYGEVVTLKKSNGHTLTFLKYPSTPPISNKILNKPIVEQVFMESKFDTDIKSQTIITETKQESISNSSRVKPPENSKNLKFTKSKVGMMKSSYSNKDDSPTSSLKGLLKETKSIESKKNIPINTTVTISNYTLIKESTKKIITKYSYLISKGVLYFRLETPQVYETTNLSGLLSVEHGDFSYDLKELVGLFQIINLRKI